MARDYLFKTIDPQNPDGPTVDVRIPGVFYERLYKHSPVRYENLRAVKYTLENVERIFWGIREFNEGGFCYTARPKEWFVATRSIATFPDHLVFAVYLNPAMMVYEFRSEPSDKKDGFSPAGWRDRYTGLKWKRTS